MMDGSNGVMDDKGGLGWPLSFNTSVNMLWKSIVAKRNRKLILPNIMIEIGFFLVVFFWTFDLFMCGIWKMDIEALDFVG